MKKFRTALAVLLAAAGLIMLSGSGKNDFKVGRNMQILMNMYRDVNIFYVDSIDSDKMLKDAAEGMTKNLDPYTDFLSEEDMKYFEIMTTGKYGGMGSLIRGKDGYVIIAQPYKGFPADKAGLKIGDRILEVDGVSVKGMELSKVSDMLKGDPGTTFTLKVHKFYADTVQEVSIKREKITIPGVPFYGFVSDNIGYIQHDDFTEGSAEEVRNAFMSMRKTGNLEGLIIDLRSNGGGILQEAVKIMSFFAPKGTEVVSTIGKQTTANEKFVTRNAPIDLDIPIVLLVGSGSASAAEIVAGAMQDLDRGVVMGRRTFGKGLVQTTRPLGYNSMLKVTTAKYYIPSGRCIQAIDYTHRNEDGSVGNVPDSLIREFRTRGGRLVYDGGGVMPDVVIDPEYASRFAVLLYTMGYVDDFVDIYMKTRPAVTDPVNFRLTDQDFEDFVRFMDDKDVEYRSETKKLIGDLKKKAEAELYLDKISGDIAQLEQHIKDDKASSLIQYRDQIVSMIEDGIILRGFYMEGVTQRRLNTDREVAAAVKLLSNPAEFKRILTSQDTQRK